MEDIRIYFIGDSYVNGTYDPDFLGWPGRVCAASQSPEVGITAYNLGIRADTSEDVRRRWKNEVVARRLIPHDGRIVFAFGANDCFLVDGKKRIERPATEENAEAILSEASEMLPVLMIGPPPGLGQEQDDLRQDMDGLMKKICGRTGVPYLSVIDDLRAEGVWQQEAAKGDQIHPSAGGYSALADLVLQWPEWWFFKGSDE